jgi:Lon protease-like protein
MAMFPLSTVLMPHAPLALHVFEERYRALVADCLADRTGFGVVLITRGSEVGGGDERVSIGTLARIDLAQPLPDGRWALVARGTKRIRVESWLGEDPYPRATVEVLDEPVPSPGAATLHEAQLAVVRARALLSELGEDTGAAGTRVPTGPDADDTLLGEDTDDASVWRICAQAPIPIADRQLLLEAEDHTVRLELLRRLCGELSDEIARFLGGN